ncbi:uncharacterized protein LOC106466493 isoform X2 [Limulus polyphemus]|uniref:Uncharacterized protein LOC106466493 isoform X2 n=1 Tax=Limulus polyphemus TaxID=6850 RepID=A0ABM1BHQ9_LIMPO|nr:uncharacterized protein LOC106466493 isoform X2 [Limulus polyphemus]
MDQLNPYAIEVNYQHLTTEADPELHSICDATSLSTAACSSSISHKSDIVGVHQMPPLKHQESSHFRISNMLPEPDYFNLLCGPSEESNQCLSTFTDIQPENKQISTVTDETREPIFNIFQHHNYTYHSWKNLTDCGSCNLSLILTSGQSKLPTSKSFSVVSNKDFPDIEVDEYVDVVTVDDDNRSEHLAELINENYSAARCIPITEVWLSKHSLHWNTFKSISVQVEQNSSESYKSIEMSKNYKSDSSASILIDTMNSSALNKNITTHTIPQVATSKETSIKGSSSSWPQPKSLLSTVIEIGGSCYESQPSINYLNTVNRDFGCFPQNSLSKIPDYLIQFSISKPYSQSLANLCSKTSVQTFHQRSVKGNEDDLTLQVETTELYDKIPRYLKDVLKKHSSISTCRKTSGTSLLKREYMKEGPQGKKVKDIVQLT